MQNKKGFTLIELVAVVAILAILAAILVPSVNSYIVRSRKTEVIKQCREIYKAIETYNITAKEKIDCTSSKYGTMTINEFYPHKGIEGEAYVGPIFSNEDSIMGGDCNDVNERIGAISNMNLAELQEIATAEDGDILDRIKLQKAYCSDSKSSKYMFAGLD